MAVTGLGARSASLGTNGPLQPVSLNTVDRTGLDVTLGSCNSCWAFDATMSSSPSHGAVTRPDSTTARFAAGRPGRERRDNTVDGACVSVAGFFLEKTGAHNTTMLGVQKNRTGSLVSTTTTGLGTSSEGRPFGHLAIDLLESTFAGSTLALGVAASVAAAALFSPSASQSLECVDGALEAGTTAGRGDTNTLRTGRARLNGRAYAIRGTSLLDGDVLGLEGCTSGDSLAYTIGSG